MTVKTMIKLSTNNFDELGLVDDVSEAQLDLMADQFEVMDNLAPLIKGDMYLAKCKYHKVKPFSTNVMKNPAIQGFVHKLSNSPRTLQEYAFFSDRWARSGVGTQRKAGLLLAHYKHVEPLRAVNPGAADKLLAAAQLGRDTGKGWEAPYPAKWVKEQVTAKLGIEKPAPGPKEPEQPNDYSEAAFVAAVDAAVKPLRAKLRKQIKEAEILGRNNLRLQAGISTTVTEAEFKTLRLFCHPDKHPGNEAKARKAFDIALKIGEKLGFTE